MTLDLNEVRQPPDSRFLSGRPSGEKARRHFKLDSLDKSDDKAVVTVPDDLYALNLSFFLGMFGPSVRKYGPEEFRKKYIFTGRSIHQKTVEEGISRAVAEATIFPSST
jgi:hypothetical protein